ncbi:uncharacterized protein C1orf21 homolog isoform X2 [Lithobates pipiens]
MGCASAKHVSTVQNEEDTQNGKNYQNGDAFCDEYRFKPVEEVKYMKDGEEEEQKIVTRNQENLEKSATHNIRPKNNEAQGAGYPNRIKFSNTIQPFQWPMLCRTFLYPIICQVP